MAAAKTNVPTRVILHCAASPDYLETDPNFDRIGSRQITSWHLDRGFNGIGYHFIVRRSGFIENGRSIDIFGAHTQGQNYNSIGVCYVGTRRPSEKQISALLDIYVTAFKLYRISYDQWFGHYEFNSGKECPGFSMDIFRVLLKFYHQSIFQEN